MKRKYISKSLIFVIICFIINTKSFGISRDDTTYVKTEKYEGIIFGKNYPKNWEDDKKSRWSPSIEDIAYAEKKLEKYIFKKSKKVLKNQDINGSPIIRDNLKNYMRQYVGFINNRGDYILYIKFIWKDEILKNDYFKNWKTELRDILGGGSYYWSIKIKIKNGKCFDYSVG